MKEYIKKFFYLLDEQAKKFIPFLIISFLISSLLDVIGIGLIGLFLGLLANPNFLADKFFYIGISYAWLRKTRVLFIAGLFIIGALAAKAMIVMSIQKKVVFFLQAFSVRLKTRLMTVYQYAPYIYHLEKNSAHLLSRIQGNIDSYITNVLGATLTCIANLLITICIALFLLIVQPIPTLVLGGMFIVLGVGYDLFAKKHFIVAGKTIASKIGEINKNIQNGLHGLTEVRVLGRETYFIEKLTKNSLEAAHANSILYAKQLAPRYLIENLMAIFMVAISFVGILAGYSTAHILAVVGIFAIAGARLLPTVLQIMSSINLLRGYTPQMNLVYDEFIEVDQLIANSSQSNLLPYREDKLVFSEIQLKKIYYQYPKSDFFALNDININIIKGQSIGLIGTSGAGKSTLVNLLLGFLDPNKGQLLVDGKPISNLRMWLNNFAYIPQSIFLLDDTICRNIAFGIDDEKIDKARLWNAINMARLEEVIEHLLNGVETPIGENGVKLSGGQRQRVALARAFYHEREIIVLDEATSSLDNNTEDEIINTLKELKNKKTLIVIAHRSSTVEHCDVLYRLERGSVVASGTYPEVVGFSS
ncbi:MAG TPA: ABC transporter ATP-binding protein [Gammaproteobacteria bacterium]|nr:ABC transporter ATP-binding protein [Gammaproteobacteria bacterium]